MTKELDKKTAYNIEYAKTHKKRISFDVQKTYYENTLKPYCEKLGMPVNTVIKRALKEKMIRDGFIKED